MSKPGDTQVYINTEYGYEMAEALLTMLISIIIVAMFTKLQRWRWETQFGLLILLSAIASFYITSSFTVVTIDGRTTMETGVYLALSGFALMGNGYLANIIIKYYKEKAKGTSPKA